MAGWIPTDRSLVQSKTNLRVDIAGREKWGGREQQAGLVRAHQQPSDAECQKVWQASGCLSHSHHLSLLGISLNCLLEGLTNHLKEKETIVEPI